MIKLAKIAMSMALALGMTTFAAGTSQAAVVVDSSVGGTFDFDWDDGLGPIDGIEGGSETEWSMTVGADSILSLAAAEDLHVAGDEFALVFDGLVIAWTTETTLGSGHFLGELTDLFLTAGTHTFSLNLTTLASGFDYGSAEMSFGIATPVSAVPVPAALPLALAAFGLLGVVGKRRRRANAA